MERFYNIPLRNAKLKAGRTKRAPRAIKEIKLFVAKHMKSSIDDVWIDTHINKLIWKNGIRNIPSKIRVKVVKFEDGLVEVDLPEAIKEREEEIDEQKSKEEKEKE
ncbi:MAG: 50S ribosomal protein L31e [Candidatus Thermoplasmatota archaeon]|nr:50S ribosomal protein L31e [Candidatus Thermoplasmatota archaeon]MCL5963448.1 50S ribosomal protein L31e [Candidatus Thermoplasmatota archaeon]